MKIWQKYHYSGTLFRCFELKMLIYIQSNLMRPSAPPGRGALTKLSRWPLYRQYILSDQQETDLRTEKVSWFWKPPQVAYPFNYSNTFYIKSVLRYWEALFVMQRLLSSWEPKKVFLQPSLLAALAKGCSLLWAHSSFDPHCISKALPRATHHSYQREG